MAQSWASRCTGIPRELVKKGANAPGKHKASMLQDVLAGRQTEVDFMNGAIVQVGREVRRSDAPKQGDVGADQRPGTFVDGSGLRTGNQILNWVLKASAERGTDTAHDHSIST